MQYRSVSDRLRLWAEYAVVLVMFKLVRLLSFEQASAVGAAIGTCIGPLMKPLNKRAFHNLRMAFPEKTELEIKNIIKCMWLNFSRSVLESMVIDKIDPFDPKGVVTVSGHENLNALKLEGGFLFGAHFANWEMMPKVCYELGLNPLIVYRKANNQMIDQLIQSNRHRLEGMDMVPKGPEGARALLKATRQKRIIGMLVDQKMNDGIPVPFFGRDAMTAPALAQLALKGDKLVVPVHIVRVGKTRFRVTYGEPYKFKNTGDNQADILAAMTRVNETLESWIRAHPEQWFWMHNRWPKGSEGFPIK